MREPAQTHHPAHSKDRYHVRVARSLTKPRDSDRSQIVGDNDLTEVAPDLQTTDHPIANSIALVRRPATSGNVQMPRACAFTLSGIPEVIRKPLKIRLLSPHVLPLNRRHLESNGVGSGGVVDEVNSKPIWRRIMALTNPEVHSELGRNNLLELVSEFILSRDHGFTLGRRVCPPPVSYTHL